MNRPPGISLMDRIRLVGYGLIGGLVAGAVLGWMFHAWIGFLFKLFILLILLVPFIAAVIFWQRVTSKPTREPAVDVREADWVEIEASSRTRR